LIQLFYAGQPYIYKKKILGKIMKDLIQNKYLKYLSIQKKDCIYRFSIKNQFKKDDDEDL
jgi:hypothetical protein